MRFGIGLCRQFVDDTQYERNNEDEFFHAILFGKIMKFGFIKQSLGRQQLFAPKIAHSLWKRKLIFFEF